MGNKTGQAQGPGDFKEYTSGTGFVDSTTWAGATFADWVEIIGAGTTVVTTEAGAAAAAPYNRTITTDATEPYGIFHGPFTALVSSTATRVRMGTGVPPVMTNAVLTTVNLASGTVTGALPRANMASDVTFGDGSDGTVTFDGVATILGMAPSTNVYTATRDLYLANGTINAGVTLNMAGFKLFCSGMLTIAATGVLSNNGNAGGASSASTGGAAGAISAAGSTAQGTAGGAGSSGSGAGSAGSANSNGFPGTTQTGGTGGGDGTHSGGAQGTYTALVATKGGARQLFALIAGMVFGTSTISPFGGGAGGGGGAANNADGGGGGGGGGGGVLIAAVYNLVNNGTISANGGAGSAGTSAANSAGGGAGGGGGVVITVTRISSGTGNVTANGGAGGAKVGAAGVAGSAGPAGTVIQVTA